MNRNQQQITELQDDKTALLLLIQWYQEKLEESQSIRTWNEFLNWQSDLPLFLNYTAEEIGWMEEFREKFPQLFIEDEAA